MAVKSTRCKHGSIYFAPHYLVNFDLRVNLALREKYPNTELFLVRIFLYFGVNTEIYYPNTVRLQENTDQK